MSSYMCAAPEPYTESALSARDDILGVLDVASLYEEFVRPYLDNGDPVQIAAKNTTIKIKSQGQDLRRKFPRDYSQLVPDIRGHVVVKKNNMMRDLVLDPSVQSVPVEPFSERAVRQSFSLEPGVLPGFDSDLWSSTGIESERKKKKRRKE